MMEGIGSLPPAEVWSALAYFRWYRKYETSSEPDSLQQAWRSDRGNVEWKDIPVVIAPRESSK